MIYNNTMLKELKQKTDEYLINRIISESLFKQRYKEQQEKLLKEIFKE